MTSSWGWWTSKPSKSCEPRNSSASSIVAFRCPCASTLGECHRSRAATLGLQSIAATVDLVGKSRARVAEEARGYYTFSSPTSGLPHSGSRQMPRAGSSGAASNRPDGDRRLQGKEAIVVQQVMPAEGDDHGLLTTKSTVDLFCLGLIGISVAGVRVFHSAKIIGLKP